VITLRKAHVNCPKCGHGFTVRDNGGLSKDQADKVWRAVDDAWAAIDRVFAQVGRIWK
jgi:hypothetical protein